MTLLYQACLRIAYIGLAIGAVTSLVGFLSAPWFCEWFAHFRMQLFCGGLCVFVVLLAHRKFPLALLALGLSLLNLAIIAPFYGLSKPAVVHMDGAKQARVHFRLMQVNVFTHNAQRAPLLALLEAEDPDILVLQECNQSWLKDLAPFTKRYPHRFELPRGDNFGIAMYTRLANQGIEPLVAGSGGLPSLSSELKIGNQPLHIITTHPVPPTSRRMRQARDQQMHDIALACQNRKRSLSGESEMILCGDFNNTPWTKSSRAIETATKLRNAMRDVGGNGTWSKNPLLRIPIDHALVSRGIQVHRRERGPDIGSDHYPVTWDFSVTPLQPRL